MWNPVMFQVVKCQSNRNCFRFWNEVEPKKKIFFFCVHTFAVSNALLVKLAER